jgi:hypothetical protein
MASDMPSTMLGHGVDQQLVDHASAERALIGGGS